MGVVNRIRTGRAALWVLVFSLFIYLPFSFSQENQKTRVLVLHSYHKGLEWTDSITRGIESVLGGRKDVEIWFEYMDTRRVHDETYLNLLHELYFHKFRHYRFDVIISSDDHAFNFLLTHHADLFPETPVVFCGVNYFKDEMLAGRHFFTGLVESFDIRGTLDVALRLHPNTRQIVTVVDATATGKTNKKLLSQLMPDYENRLSFRFIEEVDMAELQKTVRSLPQDSIILLLHFIEDKSGHIFSLEDSAEMISRHANRPIYSFWDFYLNHGIVGGMLTSGLTYGEKAAEMALRILNKESPGSIPVVKNSSNRYMFDFRMMEKFGIKPSQIPEGSLVINRSYSLYYENRPLFWKVAGVIIGLILIIILFIINLFKRLKAQRALRRSEDKFRSLVETTSDWIWEMDKNIRYTYVSPKVKDLLGYAPDEVIGKTPFDLMPPDEGDRVSKIFRTVIEEKKQFKALEHLNAHKEGRHVMIETSGVPILDHHGELTGYRGIDRDVSERKQDERVRKRLTAVVEQTRESIIITDRKGFVEYVNPAFEAATGYGRDEIIGNNFRIFKSDKHSAVFYQEMWELISQGRGWQGHIINRRKDGSLIEFETTISPIHDETGDICNFVSVNRDVTHEVQMERQLHQAMKMEAIGTLAGGIAHDFNNILSAVFGYAELSMMLVEEDSKLDENLKKILKAAERARDLVKQILTFSRQTENKLNPLQIKIIVKETLKLLRASLPSTIDIKQDIESDSMALADPSQIHQLMLNLCTNASQSMQDDGGTLTVGLKDVEADETTDDTDIPLKPGRYLKLSIRDTGHGIPLEIRERIFDPFFTTKGPGEGTGMGLSVVHGIAEVHGAKISVSSQPGKGTTFNIYFPTIEKTENKKQSKNGWMPAGTERILWVDDEAFQADLGKQILENLGYKVTARTSSAEAFEVFRAHPDSFDLIITDMTMPNMTGDKLARKILEIRPDMPVILCTGYSRDATEEKIRESGIRACAMKPLSRNELAGIVRKVLDGKPLEDEK
jgi:PAS domain S-box-containing protein